MNHPLVSTDWLAEHLKDATLRIVDIRGHVIPASEPPPHYFNHRADYDKSHIPGAVFVDWVHEITDPEDPRHAKIAKPERYTEVMRRLGLTPETLVVAYDDAAGMFAARLWWSLRYYGHDAVAVLDGGWNKWIAEKRPTTSEVPNVTPTDIVAHPHPELIRTADQVEAALGSESRLLDVRTPEEYQGKSARAARKGHIPGARNVPRLELVTPEGTMLLAKELRKRFAQAGVDDNAPEVICYCNGGVSASYGLLAMQVAGLNNGAVYDGSWKEWGNDEKRPME